MPIARDTFVNSIVGIKKEDKEKTKMKALLYPVNWNIAGPHCGSLQSAGYCNQQEWKSVEGGEGKYETLLCVIWYISVEKRMKSY